MGTDAEANVITLTYAKRADLTYTINYVDEQGNAIDTAKVVNDAVFGTVVTASSEAKDIDGYTYKSADRESITVGTDAEANVITLTYANAILSYTVEYYYDDTLGETDTAPAVFNSPVTVNPATSTTRNDVNYTLVNVTPADGITIGVDETANVIRVYYEKDTITDPNNDGNGENPGDGIPDKYQAVVNYESANDAQGTVNLAQKVITFANNATSGTVNIFDGVVTNPTAGFVFDGWTEGGNAVASNLTRVLQGNTEYTFIATQVVIASGGQHLDHAAVDGKHRDVEGAAAQVIDHDGLVLLLVHAIGKRGCRGLVDDALHVEPGDDASVLGRLALRIGEVCGHGDDRVGDRLAQVALGVLLELGENHGRNLLRQVLLPVNADGLGRTHLALDRADGAIGVHGGLALGDLAHQALAFLRERDDRRRRTRALGVDDDARATAFHHRDTGIGCAQIYADESTH